MIGQIFRPFRPFTWPQLSGRGGGGFSALSLFADGQTGYLWQAGDPVFTAPDATVLAASVGNAAGLALDVSQGAGYASGSFQGLENEVYADPEFDDPAAWNGISSTTIAGGQLIHDGSDTGYLRAFNHFGGTAPGFFAVSVDYASGAAGLQLYNSGPLGAAVSPAAETTFVYSDGAAKVMYRFTAGNPITLNSVSQRKLPGSHASQSNASFKGRIAADAVSINGDGIDDRLPTKFQHGASGCIAARVNGDAGGRFVWGAQGSSTGRAYLGLDGSGRAAGGVGGDATTTIFGGSDLRGTWATLILNWDGSTVTLTVDGTEVYSGAQNGNPAAVDAYLLGLNNNGTGAAFWDGDVKAILVRDEALTAGEITQISNAWSAL